MHTAARLGLASLNGKPVDKPRPGAQPVDNSGAMEDAARMIEELQGRVGGLEDKLLAGQDRQATLERELATLTTERREAESRYLEAAVGRGEAQATRAALESALTNANAANARLAAMKPTPAPEPNPPAPPTPWEMDVERDGAGQIRRIVATPKAK
jgi:hypothetical protein